MATPLVLTLSVAIGAVGAGALNSGSADAAVCTATGTAGTAGSADLLVDGAPMTAAQVANAQIISAVGTGLGVSGRGQTIAVATAIQESRLRNLDYGDRDSLGLFQQRAPWGSEAARMDPISASRMFYTGGAAGQRGLLDISGWENMSLTVAAQAVQVSGHPDAYAQWETVAASLVESFGQSSGSIICTGLDSDPGVPDDLAGDLPDGYALPADTSPAVVTSIVWALQQLGTPYQWGGTCTDPHSGIASKRCDCSSLVQQSYRHAGISLPRTTSQQIHSGSPVYDTAALKPGDLIFLPGHVGLYMGQGLIVHAPQTGDVVKISQLSGWRPRITGMRRIVA
ncbi:C40 family peptidase [Kineosporia babensis]|uniref:C40 family peptidase n=1 Tax=Kineosporia babensis TaxID=499548 RepID=A0A9X1SYB0_9ACTN|nr:C40 family peptidase [Kineosporia babensis]MCD5316165.1 C40 family peptidase [Kineosporia babensis]